MRSDTTATDSRTTPVKCAICGAEHKYDCSNIGPVQFLQDVMHDPTVPMHHRIKAADHLLRLRDKDIYSDDLGEVLTYMIPEQRWMQ
jgi:hypothetical protein